MERDIQLQYRASPTLHFRSPCTQHTPPDKQKDLPQVCLRQILCLLNRRQSAGMGLQCLLFIGNVSTQRFQ